MVSKQATNRTKKIKLNPKPLIPKHEINLDIALAFHPQTGEKSNQKGIKSHSHLLEQLEITMKKEGPHGKNIVKSVLFVG